MRALWSTTAFKSKHYPDLVKVYFQNNRMWSHKSKLLLINCVYSFLFLHISLRQLLVYVRSFYPPRCIRVLMLMSEMLRLEREKLHVLSRADGWHLCPQSWASCDWLSSVWLPSHWTPGRGGFDSLTVVAGGAGPQRQDCIVPLRYHIPAWLLQHSCNDTRQVRSRTQRSCFKNGNVQPPAAHLTWSRRSTSDLGASPNSCASRACTMFLLTR